MRFAPCLTLASLLAVGVAAPAGAQGPWSLVVGGSAAGFGGASTSPDGGDVGQIKPAPTTRFHVGAARAFGKAGVTFDASYSKAGLGGYGEGQSYSLSPALTLYDLRLLASYEVARLGESSLRLALGPMLQSWSGDAILDAQTRFGGAVAVTIAVPITRRVGLLVSGSLAVAGCPFDSELLESAGGFEPASVWTRELGVGVRLSL